MVPTPLPILLALLALFTGLGCNAIIGVDPGTARTTTADGGAGGAPGAPCTSPADCPTGPTCTNPVCTASHCGLAATPAGSPCVDDAGNGAVCDGNGACVDCVTNPDCAAKHPERPVCDPATHLCVSCADGIQNGRETGVDCGGPDCGACLGETCHPSHGCGSGALCAMPENLCCASACDQKCEACSQARTGQPNGTCAPVLVGEDPDGECATLGGCGAVVGKCRCEDGTENGDETDVDCGGTTCAGCGGGKACEQDADCSPTNPACVNHACCDSLCTATCTTCNPSGQCGHQPQGHPDPACPTNSACGTLGMACLGRAGFACGSSGGKCLSGVCSGGTCQKGATGKPCTDGTDCLSGTCQSYLCL